MTVANVVRLESNLPRELRAGIFDVDGVLLASPHEKAWRDALEGLTDPKGFTTRIYQDHVAGKPRLVGAKAALQALGLEYVDRHIEAYAQRKQNRLEELIAAKEFSAFLDALRFIHALDDLGWVLCTLHNVCVLLMFLSLELSR